MRQPVSTVLQAGEEGGAESTLLLHTEVDPYAPARPPRARNLVSMYIYIALAVWLIVNGIYWGMMIAFGGKVINDLLPCIVAALSMSCA